MLTFFRRIRKGLLENGRISRYLLYAIGEILLVMIGILLALQVNNWNQSRIDRSEEERILHHLHKEFQLNKVKLNEIREVMDHNQDACREILALIGSSEVQLRQKNLDSLLYYSMLYVGYNPTQNVLSDLLNSGRLQLITDESLKNMLYEWSQMLLEMQEWYITADNWFQQQVLPYLSNYVSFRRTSSYEVTDKVQPSKLSVDPYVIFHDLQYENFMENLRYVLQRYVERLERIDQIIDTILERTAQS